MQSAQSYLTTLARVVELSRRPGHTGASIQDALRLLVSRAQERALLVTLAPGLGVAGVLVDDQPLDSVDAGVNAGLVAQLRAHEVRRLEIRQHAPTAELANLVRWLAREAGPRGRAAVTGRQALAALGLWHVEVAFVGEESLAEALAHDHRAGVPRQIVARYVAAAQAATESRALERALVGLDALVDAYATTGEACPVAAALVGLQTLSEMCERRPAAARAVAAPLIAAVRDRLGTPVVACLAAQRLAELPPAARPPLLAAIGWLGAPGAAALVAHLMASDQLAVRRVYYDALVTLRVGIPLLTDALGHEQWFMVRNAACLLGDMGAVEADVHLAALLEHADPRVREAAAAALAQLGTPTAQAALTPRLRDPSPALRHCAARGVAQAALTPAAGHEVPGETTAAWLTRQGNPSPAAPGDAAARAVAPLTSALAYESDLEVQVAILHSLGRLGTPDAIQRLRLAVRPAPTHSSAFRAAALEALVEAQGDLARPVAEALCRDPDPQVQHTAARLVALASGGPPR